MAEAQKKKGGIIKGTAKTIGAVYLAIGLGCGLWQVFNDHSEGSVPMKFGQGAVTGMWGATQKGWSGLVTAWDFAGEAAEAGYDRLIELNGP